MSLLSGALLSAAIGAVGCGDDTTTSDNFVSETDGGVITHPSADADAGAEAKIDGGHATVNAPPNNTSDAASQDQQQECGDLMAHIRDFSSRQGHSNSNPDFETYTGSGVKGLVKDTLGSDGKPVFNTVGSPQMITSAASFAQWYNDTPGVNIDLPYTIPLKQMAGNTGTYEFASTAFFPIDNEGWDAPNSPMPEPMLLGDDGKLHNFSFTTEVHTSFTYHGGENFSFMGDDDLWIFVNSKLALDLGGLHASQSGTIDFDAMASQLGIVKGQTYRMDVFHAERHTTASNFTIRTNIDCFKPVIAI